jgi:hypothetical protein
VINLSVNHDTPERDSRNPLELKPKYRWRPIHLGRLNSSSHISFPILEIQTEWRLAVVHPISRLGVYVYTKETTYLVLNASSLVTFWDLISAPEIKPYLEQNDAHTEGHVHFAIHAACQH